MAFSPMLEINEMIRDLGGETLNECMQCGLCSGLCPWGKVESPFYTRALIRMGQLGMEGYETDDILFACTTCKICELNCPREVKIIDIVEAMRTAIGEYGGLPQSLKAISGSIHANGNPWSGDRADRFKWADEVSLPEFSDDKEFFLSICCTSCYDPRGIRIAKALVEIFNRVNLSYGVIGVEESCCGQAIKKAGAVGEFEMLKEANVSLFRDRGVKKVIFTSPHCCVGYRDDYPELKGIEIYHYTQILFELILNGTLKFDRKIQGKIIYHDPCYLGRHWGLYEEPRKILEAISSEEIVEFDENREFSLCCGAGGGRMWMETAKEQRFSDIKVKEAHEKGATILATCCPYCVNMFEDSVKTTGVADKLVVKDIAELVLEALLPSTGGSK